MKKVLAIALAAVCAAGVAVSAERGGGEGRGNRRAQCGEVTEEQKTALREARESTREAMQTAKSHLQTEMTALRGVVQDTASTDAALTAAIAKVETAQAEVRAAREASQAKMNEILTPRQRACLLLRQAHQGRERGSNRGGRGEGRGGSRD